MSLYHNFDYFCLSLLGVVWLLDVVSSYYCGLPFIAVNGKRKNPFCAPLRPKGHMCNKGSLSQFLNAYYPIIRAFALMILDK